MEVLVYIGLVFVILGFGFTILYRCLDHSMVLRRSTEDIASALRVGERWRADIRAAHAAPRIEQSADGPILHLTGARGEIAYWYSANAVFRRTPAGAWSVVLDHVQSSRMESDSRSRVAAWRWELELQPQVKGSVKPGRVRPLFTFEAVPQTPAAP
jgi:hypothetical protein